MKKLWQYVKHGATAAEIYAAGRPVVLKLLKRRKFAPVYSLGEKPNFVTLTLKLNPYPKKILKRHTAVSASRFQRQTNQPGKADAHSWIIVAIRTAVPIETNCYTDFGPNRYILLCGLRNISETIEVRPCDVIRACRLAVAYRHCPYPRFGVSGSAYCAACAQHLQFEKSLYHWM